MICKISPLLKFEILGVFFNTLIADVKYPVRDWQNLKFYYLNGIILKTENIFWIVCSIYGIFIKF